jgi:AraC-like DNA-binding protein
MYPMWHYHQEIEINLVLNGSGTRFIGNHIEDFKDEDLVLIGSNLPHVWKNDPQYFTGDPDLYAHVINLQFQEDFGGKDLLSLPEFATISDLLKKSHQGIRFYGETYKEVAKKMLKIVHLEGFERFMELLFVLDILSKSIECYCLSSEGFMKKTNPHQVDKINKVYDFMLTNFTKPINVEDVASVANMNSAAFCRFFKQVMMKTFVRFLTELRIGHACKLLISSDITVAGVCFESGFQNLSNFNRQFKEYTGKTPIEYKKEFRVKISV